MLTETESFFRQAVKISHGQGAKSWELGAITSLSRLYQQEGKRDEARQLMEEIYGRFIEGGNPDLREARLLLEDLAEHGSRMPA